MAPGDLLAPAQLSEGALVQAEDPGGFWYNAKVIQKTGHGKRAKVTVRYIGFGPSHNETFGSTTTKLRERLPAAELKSDLGGRTVTAKVRGAAASASRLANRASSNGQIASHARNAACSRRLWRG